MKNHPITLLLLLTFLHISCEQKQIQYDILIKNGQIVDGSGKPSYPGDIAINADTIAAVGYLENAIGKKEIDAAGLSVAPGFINMLSWSNVSLLEDGRSQGDIRQGVTLEVLGEGNSMGPLSESMKTDMINGQGDIKYDIPWTTLGEYLSHLEEKGISTNVASFVGNATLRSHTIGIEKRPPTEKEMTKMRELLRQGMEEGAVGLSTSLIYVPSGHAQTNEIIELAKVVSEYDGMYVSHIRDEEGGLLEAVNELITISKEAKLPAEIYHFKASGNANWHLLDSAINLVENARKDGLSITTDMYMYNASSTGLNVVLPAWAKDGGHSSTIQFMKNPAKRKQMMDEIDFHVPPDKILMVGFRKKEMRKYIGKTLADIASERNKSPNETLVNLIYEDDSRIQVVYFSMSEENIKKKLQLPYMSICSDAGSYTNEGIFLEQSTHPRAYGSFARLLGHFVREEKVISLEEAVHKLSTLPATNLKLKKRGSLKEGYFADVVIFDANTITDNATFEKPHQYATGMRHVFVNGGHVLKYGEHTGESSGRFVKGPGWRLK